MVHFVEQARDWQVPLSIDTVKPAVMRAALAAGADMINDINAFRAPGAIEVVASGNAGLCLMHMRGEPRTMQQAPAYDDVVGEVHRFLAERIFVAEMAGIAKKHILVDPGFGFGKTVEHNFTLLRELQRFASLGCPVVAGLSRKSMIGAVTGHPVERRVVGSAVAAVLAAESGAMILRVHDVAATREALAVWSAWQAQPAPAPVPAASTIRWPDED